MDTQAYSYPLVHHRTARIKGLDIFYREAGPQEGVTIVLLHGFPASSHMFRNLIPVLAKTYRVIAPDYPGFGLSGMPDPTLFQYSFSAFAEIVETLLRERKVDRFVLYMMDYGGPVGYRLAMKLPDQVVGLIVQNAIAYEEGLTSAFDLFKDYWENKTVESRDALRTLLTADFTKFQYLNGVSDPTRVDPATWIYDQSLLDRVGNADIQLDLFYDYRTNFALYPKIHEFFKVYQPPTLIVWGKNDEVFPESCAQSYIRDLPHAEMHLVDSGHFAMEDRPDEIIPLIQDYLTRLLAPAR